MWTVVDSRSGEPATACCFLTRKGADRQIEQWRERDRKGGRPDVSHLMPFLEACQLSTR